MLKYKYTTWQGFMDEFTAADDAAAKEWAAYRAQIRGEQLKQVQRCDRVDAVGETWTVILDSPKVAGDAPPADLTDTTSDILSVQVTGKSLDTYTRTLAALAVQNGGIVKVPANMVEAITGLVMYHDGDFIVMQGFTK